MQNLFYIKIYKWIFRDFEEPGFSKVVFANRSSQREKAEYH